MRNRSWMRRGVCFLTGLTAAIGVLVSPASAQDREASRIQPWGENNFYWQYEGKPVLLLGASDQDNLFQYPTISGEPLESHLDRLSAAGGNYLRNTLSNRDAGNEWWYAKDASTGKYDLSQFNDTWFNRLTTFLDETAERDIVVQIEVFDRFDFYRDNWQNNPFNPDNNVNYEAGDSDVNLSTSYDTHPNQNTNPFFKTQKWGDNANATELRAYQEALVEKIIETTLPYDHVLYTISNETNEAKQWSYQWGDFINAQADQAGKGIELTEMWDDHSITRDPYNMHARSLDDRFTFIDLSQNNASGGQEHWDNLQWWIDKFFVEEGYAPRPINSTKIYGGPGEYYGDSEDATHKFWRNILGGEASSRFHRPDYGMGLNDLALTQITSMRMLEERVDIFAIDAMNELLSERDEDEAYLAAVPGEQYALYFTDGGEVMLDLTGVDGSFQGQWLNIGESAWGETFTLEGGEEVRLTAPESGQWVAAIIPEPASLSVLGIGGLLLMPLRRR
ncbi:MAG: hypothetical protein ACLFV3_03520 [Phycisphaeraceae bacterium]